MVLFTKENLNLIKLKHVHIYESLREIFIKTLVIIKSFKPVFAYISSIMWPFGFFFVSFFKT